MYKNIAISLLGAWVLRDVFGTTEVREQIAIVMGLAAMLFIFLLFLRGSAGKIAEKAEKDPGTGTETGRIEGRENG